LDQDALCGTEASEGILDIAHYRHTDSEFVLKSALHSILLLNMPAMDGVNCTAFSNLVFSNKMTK